MGLAYKSLDKVIYVDPSLESSKNEFAQSELTIPIRDWLRSKTTLSFKDFYLNNSQIQKEILKQDSEVRLLMKSNPKTIKISTLDF